jgi:hypothetical protein
MDEETDTMSSDFEWRFGDELPEGQGQAERESAPSWQRWLPLLLMLLLVIGGAYAWWRDRQQNLDEAESQVLQVARLELRALDEGDSELYLSLQDPADRSWKKAQEAYISTRGLPLPLQDLTSPITTVVESGRIVGDRAQVVVVHSATLPSGEEGVFRAVRFYRYTSDGRWLHTSVDPSHGGHDVVFVSDDLEITIFANDPIRMDALARQLAALPYEFCSLVPCRRYSLFGIDSTSDPERARVLPAVVGFDATLSMTLAANLEEAAEPDDTILPASFLVGAPGNAEAQAAWEASLGQFLVDYLIDRQIGPRPADEHGGALLEERLRAWFKAELEVSEPISPDLALVRDALEEEAWIPLWRLWSIGPSGSNHSLAAAEIDLLLAFIEEELGPSAVAELLHSVRETSSTEQLLNHLPWAELLHSVPEGGRAEQLLNPVPWPARSSVELQFPAYVRQRTATSTDDLSAFASYELLVGCSEKAQAFRAAELWGWRLESAEPVLLSARPPDEGLVPISWSPDGTRLLLRRQSTSFPRIFLQSVRGALRRLVVPDGASPGYLGPSGWSPDGSRLAYLVFTSQSPGSIDMETRIVDFETGDETALDGRFIAWSPNGSGLLYAQPSASKSESGAWLSEVPVHDFFMAERDGTVLRRIGEGYAAAWSPGEPEDRQIATVSTEQALMAYNLAAGRSTTLLDRDALREALHLKRAVSAASDRPFRLAWSPDGEWIAMGVTHVDDQGEVESIILLARPGEHRLLREEFGRIVDLAWTPNGRWLHLFVYHGDQVWTSVIERDGSLFLREENGVVTWSPDGQHLALTRLGDSATGLQILDIESGKRERIDASGTCWSPLWNPCSPTEDP